MIKGEELIRYHNFNAAGTVKAIGYLNGILRAYPVKWTGPELKADGSSTAFESLELGHEGIQKADEDD